MSKAAKREESNHGIASLAVAEAHKTDVGRRIARIDPKVTDELGLSAGDAIEISAGKKKATVINWPAYSEDYGKGLIRIYGYSRNRLDIGINDRVDLRRVEIRIAKSLTLAPTEPLRITGAEDYLVGILEGQIVTKGDTIPLSIMGQRVDLVVIATNPAGAVTISQSTQISISEQVAKDALNEGLPTVTYEDVGGLGQEVQKVREMIDLPLRHPELFRGWA